MSQSVTIDHEIARDTARRSVPPKPSVAKPVPRRAEAEAPVVERVRNVGGRLMA